MSRKADQQQYDVPEKGMICQVELQERQVELQQREVELQKRQVELQERHP